MTCRIEYRPAAARFSRWLKDCRLPQGLTEAIGRLAENPRPPGAVKLKGFPYLRLRVGDCRIIYRVFDDQNLVLVIMIARQREVCR